MAIRSSYALNYTTSWDTTVRLLAITASIVEPRPICVRLICERREHDPARKAKIVRNITAKTATCAQCVRALNRAHLGHIGLHPGRLTGQVCAAQAGVCSHGAK